MDEIFDRGSKGLCRPRLVFEVHSCPRRDRLLPDPLVPELETRPLVQTNDPHLPESLEPEHAHTQQ